MGEPETATIAPGSDHFYMEVWRIVHELVLRKTGDKDKAADYAQTVVLDQFERHRTGRRCCDPSRPMHSYLAVVVWRLLLQEKRSRRRSARLHREYEKGRLYARALASDTLDALVAGEQARLARETLAAMSPERRDCYLAVREQKLSLAEVAAERGVAVGTVKNNVYRAWRDLRQALDLEDKLS